MRSRLIHGQPVLDSQQATSPMVVASGLAVI